jgi:hypothetical protein
MANAIRYSPFELGGAGFRRLYIEWGCATLLQLMQSLRTPNSYQGKMAMIMLAWTQQYIGLLFLVKSHVSDEEYEDFAY